MARQSGRFRSGAPVRLGAALAALALALGAPAGATECVNPAGSGGCFASIQAAVAAADPGETIAIRPGVYHGALIVDKSVQLLGTGATPRTVVIDGDHGAVPTVAALAADVRLRNLTVRNGGGNLVQVVGPGARLTRVVLRGGSRCVLSSGADTRIVGARMSSCSLGVEATGAALLLQNSSVTTAMAECTRITSDGFRVVGSRFAGCGTNGVHVGGAGGVVSGCTVAGAGSTGILAGGAGVAVQGNVVTGAGTGGILVYSTDPVVADNRVTGAAGCLRQVCTSGCGDAQIARNVLEGCRGIGLELSHVGGSATVAGNRVTGAIGYGIYVSGGAALDLGGNRAAGVLGSGIFVPNATAALVHDNTAVDSYAVGFGIGGNGNTLRANRSTGGMQAGFVVIAGSGNTLEGNVARGGNYPFCDVGVGTVLVGNSFTTSTCPP